MGSVNERLESLYGELGKFKRLAVAFSGGVDSTLLLKAAHNVLGDSVLAVTAKSPLFTEKELDRTIGFCESENIRHIIFEYRVLEVSGFCENPANRCYICKKRLLSRVSEIAGDNGIYDVAEGSNADDDNDYRPGARAVIELSVKSPLKAAGLTKAQIRELSKELGLPTHDAPSLACLASRFPYGEEITPEKLKRVESSEKYLRGIGFGQLRVRSVGDTARIELPAEDIPKLTEEGIRTRVCEKLTEYGFTYVSLDLQGYISGSLNKQLKKD